jgi:hypothetical protein
MRAAELAAEQEQRARGHWLEVSHRLRLADQAREAVLERAARLAEHGLSPGLQGELARVGARHLVALSEQKAVLVEEAADARRRLEEAMVRSRSLERVVTRLEEAQQEERRRADEADWRDLVAVRSSRRRERS